MDTCDFKPPQREGLSPLPSDAYLIDRLNPEDKTQHLCLDKAYDAKETDELLDGPGYTGHVKRQNRSEEDKETGTSSQQDSEPIGIGEPTCPPRRWKVERSISWANNMRKP